MSLFDEKFSDIKDSSYWWRVAAEFKQHLRSQYLAMIDSEVERVEGMFLSFADLSKSGNREIDGWYNHALNDHLAYLKAQRALIAGGLQDNKYEVWN